MAKRFLWITGGMTFAVAALWLYGRLGVQDQTAGKRGIMRKLALSDFCLSTESRHTRHLSQPEPLAPFQDLPGYHDHFPSSSFFNHRPDSTGF